MPELLPLFPLSLVVLPATPLPLHIFEERYKQMMQEIEPVRGEFGVVLSRDEGIVSIGCTAVVDRVLQRYPDGRMDLIAIGQRRFTVVGVDEEKSYLRAEVEYFNDEDIEAVPPDLKQKALLLFQKLRELESPGVIIEPDIDHPQLSFQLAQFISDADRRQAVLTMRSERERMEFLLGMLPDYFEERERVALAKRVAPQNGHAKHIHGT